MSKDFIIQLNNLCQKLDILYDINNGGCCYVAYKIAKQLDKLNIKYELVVFDYISKNKSLISKEVINKRKNIKDNESVVGNGTCNHYCLYLRGYGYINKGDFDDRNKYFIKNISYKNIRWIYKKGDWNDEYLISKNSIVSKTIKSFFKHYKIS